MISSYYLQKKKSNLIWGVVSADLVFAQVGQFVKILAVFFAELQYCNASYRY